MLQINTAVIVEAATVLAAVIAIGSAVHSLSRWIQKQDQQSKDIDLINNELYVLSTAVLACLDGLTQLGADGKVTEAHNELEKHLNQRAHGQQNGSGSK